MRGVRCLVFVAVSTLLGACGGGDPGTTVSTPQSAPLTAATLGEQTVMSAQEYLAEPPYSTADPGNGEKLVGLCRACHSLDEGGAHMIGPNLFGFFGQTIASREGFDYSAAAREAQFIWTPRALDAWMAQPGRFLPGNRMTFGGINSAQDRADLIAYLLTVTAP